MPAETRSVIVQMGHVAQEIVIKTGSVIASKDVESAQTLDSDDDAMDELHRQLLSMLLDGPWKYGVQSAVDLTLIGRYYERYADWAVTSPTASSTWSPACGKRASRAWTRRAGGRRHGLTAGVGPARPGPVCRPRGIPGLCCSGLDGKGSAGSQPRTCCAASLQSQGHRRGRQQMDAGAEEEFRRFVQARWHALVRTAYLLTVTGGAPRTSSSRPW